MEISFEKKYQYRLIEDTKIDTGNSTVYKAQDLEFGRTVCVKVIHFSSSGNQALEYERAIMEVKALTGISDLTPRVPAVYNVYFDKSVSKLYVIMQWIEGVSLDKKYGKVLPGAFLGYIESLCGILEKLERKRMTHKDIKPSNIIITPDNELFLLDFNLSISTPSRTEGTQNYKAPEMGRQSVSVSRSKVDMFSIGVILYEFFTGRTPEPGKDYLVRSRRGVDASQGWDLFIEPNTLVPDLPSCINELIVRCMERDPNQRYRNILDLKRAIINAKGAAYKWTKMSRDNWTASKKS